MEHCVRRGNEGRNRRSEGRGACPRIAVAGPGPQPGADRKRPAQLQGRPVG